MFNYEMKLVLGVAALNNEIAIVQAKKPQTITLPWHQVYCYTYLVDGVYGALRHLEQYSVILWRHVLLVGKTGVPEKTTDHSYVTDKVYYIMLS